MCVCSDSKDILLNKTRAQWNIIWHVWPHSIDEYWSKDADLLSGTETTIKLTTTKLSNIRAISNNSSKSVAQSCSTKMAFSPFSDTNSLWWLYQQINSLQWEVLQYCWVLNLFYLFMLILLNILWHWLVVYSFKQATLASSLGPIIKLLFMHSTWMHSLGGYC